MVIRLPAVPSSYLRSASTASREGFSIFRMSEALVSFGQVGQEVGRLVGGHLLEDVGGDLGGRGLDEGRLEPGILDLLERLGGRLQVEGVEDGRSG